MCAGVRVSYLKPAHSRASLRISLPPSPPPGPAFFLIDPISNIERTTVQLDPPRFAVDEKCHGVLVDERHVAQIEHHRLPRPLNAEQLLELLEILCLQPPAESEHHLTVC